jgi:hypothetical protein
MTATRERDGTTTTAGGGGGEPRTRRAAARWGVRELIAGWVLYWIGLLLYALWPQLLKIYELSVTKQHGSVSLNYSGSLLEAALWIAGPPLLMAVVWIATRPRRR